MQILVVLVTVVLMNAKAQETSHFKVVRTIHAGGDGGWDYITYDAASHRLFASHATQVMVINADSGTLVGTIPNTPGVHGVTVANALKKGYISCGRSTSVSVFDLTTLAVTKEVKVGENPDAILFDPYSSRVFVFNGRSNDASVIAADVDTVVATIPMGGKPEFAVTDGAGKLFVNVEDKSEVLAIDTKSLKVLSRWSVAPGEEPSGLAFDREHHRLFSVCGNQKMIVLDSDNGHVVADLPIGKGTDGCAFDPGVGLAFASNGEGTVTVVREESPSKFSIIENAASHTGARTITVDAEHHRLYLPTAEFGPAPAPTPDRPRPRPTILPDSFMILQMER